MREIIEKLDCYFEKLINVIITILMMSMFFVIIIGVWTRYVLNNPWFGAEETARYLMIYMVFLGANIAYKNDRHPSLTFIINNFSDKFKIVWFTIIDIIMFIVLIYMFKYGLEKTAMAIMAKTPALRIPFSWVFISIPIGSILFMIQIVLKYLRMFFDIAG